MQKLLEDCNLYTIIRLPNSVFQPYASVATNLLFFDKGKPTNDIWYYEHRMPEGYKAYNKTKPIQAKEFDNIKKWWSKRQESEICWEVNTKTIIEREYDLDIKNPTKPEEEKEYSSTTLMEMLGASFEKSSTLFQHLKEAIKCLCSKKYQYVFLTTAKCVPFGMSKIPSGGFRCWIL